ncbi:DUF3885 domain-containing protein [Bacillus sp. JJ722]|uniref:DUF3885 domain-containing protein n=1 Tax=Bacillus sp. JJ722 TaxID=3122973 RepID=UPI002FFFC1AD
MITNLHTFINQYFEGLILRPSLFYSWNYSIRFEIANPEMEHVDKRNLYQIKERSTGIFNQVIHDTDEILLVTDVHCEKNDNFLHKKPTKVYKKYIKSKEVLRKLQYHLLPNVFTEEDFEEDNMVTHRFVLACKKKDIRYSQLLSAISYEDYSHPTRILKNYYRPGYDIYFLNVTKKMIYHLYDDRGCDVIASNKENLFSLYKELNNWILDYDRKQIDQLFK